VVADEPTGTVYEMDVALDAHELKSAPGYVLEPWVRVGRRDDLTLAAGIAVSKRGEDDGA
jgi:hypothetical protein